MPITTLATYNNQVLGTKNDKINKTYVTEPKTIANFGPIILITDGADQLRTANTA